MKYILCFLLCFIVSCGQSPVITSTPTIVILPSVPNATIIYYDISGSTQNELRTQLDALGPIGYDGYKGDSTTRWSITWHWPDDAEGACELSRTQISYEIKVVFPRWRSSEGVSLELKAKWTRYVAALAEHEKGHVDLVIDNIPKVKETIQNATCETANTAGETMLDEIRKQEIDYDAATNHGATQGARFPSTW